VADARRLVELGKIMPTPEYPSGWVWLSYTNFKWVIVELQCALAATIFPMAAKSNSLSLRRNAN
jgi:hypothetical protein